MPSHYCIVRYVPDPIADERINIGVVVFGEGTLKTKFIRRWSRIRGFGGDHTAFLRDFISDIEQAQTTLDGPSQPWTADTLKEVASKWTHSIQLSEPRASLEDPDRLLREVARTFLRDTAPRTKVRDRRTAAMLGAQNVIAALRGRGMEPEDLVKRKAAIEGKIEPHTFDLVVGNGRLFFAAEGLSFEGRDAGAISADIDGLAWAIADVKKERPNLPVSVIALPPPRENAGFRRAERVFKRLKASFVPEADLKKWAQFMVEKVPATHKQS